MPPRDPTVGLCLGPCGSTRVGVLFLMSETPLYSSLRLEFSLVILDFERYAPLTRKIAKP